MLSVKEMKPGIVYDVVVGSSDHTFLPGDIIWLSSKDGSIISKYGWLDKEEWNSEKTNDFKVKENQEYTIITSEKEERIWKNENIPFYQYKEAFQELKERLNKAEAELIQLRDAQTGTDAEYKRLNAKLSGLRIAIQYIRELE